MAEPAYPHLTPLDEAGAVLPAADVSAWPGMGPPVRLRPAIRTDDVHD